MPDGFGIPVDVLPSAALVEALHGAKDESERLKLLNRLAAAQQQARALISKLRTDFQSYYQETRAGNAAWEEILKWAGECHAAAEAVRIELSPIESRLSALSDSVSPDVREATQDTLDLGVALIDSIKDLEEKLRKLASERRAANGEVLRARPVKGEVDHAALSREFMARFPKIRAALAK